MFVLVRMQLRIHVDTQPVKRFKWYKGCLICILQHYIWNVASARE